MTNQRKKTKKVLTLKNTIILLNKKQKFLNDFESRVFPKGEQTQGKGRPSILTGACKVFDHKQLKILTPKQML